MADEPASDSDTPDATIERFESSAMEREAIPQVRHLVIEQLGAWGYGGDTLDAALVFSELVTNAVMHAGGAVSIFVTFDDHRLRIDVHDNGPGQPHVRVDRANVGGLGLHIVDRLSTQWGSEPTPTGKLVWAVLSRRMTPPTDRSTLETRPPPTPLTRIIQDHRDRGASI